MTEMNALTHANGAQIAAANPQTNSWISANAGSGKTRVLTNRVIRLLLRGVRPEKILCLTYTKAAAGEMQNRLFEQLGAWSMYDDTKLRDALTDLGEDGDATHDKNLSQARRLFAQALETPGGLKIQTIHAFCDSVLRRFAVEAHVAPNFQVLDDVAAANLRQEICEDIAANEDAVFQDIAGHLTDGDLSKLTADIVSNRDAFAERPDAQAFGVNQKRFDELTQQAFENPILTDLVPLFEAGGKREQDKAPELKFAVGAMEPMLRAERLQKIFIKNDGVEHHSWYPSAGTIKAHQYIAQEIQNLRETLSERKQLGQAKNSFERAVALNNFAVLFLQRFDQVKMDRAVLGYDDLIRKTCDLLSRSEMAQWVLYRLDGGIDQILVDEAQDTAPLQWQVIDRLHEEFHNQKSEDGVQKTLFVVGDDKQSIYSFQGADSRLFDQKRIDLRKSLADRELDLNETALDFSFRSADIILKLVDQVFAGTAGADFVKPPTHHSPLPDKFGRVEIWPFLDKPGKVAETPWYELIGKAKSEKHERELAKQVASYIEGRLKDGTAKPKDFLLLYRSRGRLFHETLKALKDLDLPVAGADRLVVGENLGVRDLQSILKFAVQPDDDLSLAEALVSPIFNLSQRDLYHLARNRKSETLFARLRNADEFGAVTAMLRDIRKHVDLLRPYELIERILIEHGARENLLGRLGPETQDALDAFVDQAMIYETIEPPTLSGFLTWFGANTISVKRQFSDDLDQINLMTIHGAKGLERPIVILPDTDKRRDDHRNQPRISIAKGQTLWRQTKAEAIPLQLEQDAVVKAAEAQEKMRLLYVAMTRAKNELIVAGAGEAADDDWYSLIKDAVEALGAENQNDSLVLEAGHDRDKSEAGPSSDTVTIDGIYYKPAKAHSPKPKSIAPSKLYEEYTPGQKADASDDPRVRGLYLHFVLETLPNATDPEVIFERAKQRYPSLHDHKKLFELAQSVITVHPDIFESDALVEAPVTGTAPKTGQAIFGDIDRLIVDGKKLRAIDFKSTSNVPQNDDVPKGILAQMGAYLTVLEQCFEGYEIEIGVLWTAANQYMSIPHKIAREAFDAAT